MQLLGQTRAHERDDHALMAALARRDESALALLYDRHSGTLLALLNRILRDHAEAEDVLLEVFQEAWTHAARFDPQRANPRTYLVMMARSRALSRLRARRARQPDSPQVMAEPIDLNGASPPDSATAAETGAVVVRALSELRPGQREAIECSFFEGLSHGQIADRLDRPLGTVKSDIRQGLIHLRDSLRNVYEEL